MEWRLKVEENEKTYFSAAVLSALKDVKALLK